MFSVAACSGNGENTVLPVEAGWIDPGADIVTQLTTLPGSCETETSSDDEALRRLEGKALFESPALLGGKAAQSGLSCGSCHLNGRDNPAFVFLGVSDEPGTADVTSGFFSKTHADDTFNPVPIPDLAAREGLKFPDRSPPEFRQFLATLIEGEFSGQPVPEAAMNSLIAYLAGIDPSACATGRGQQSWQSDWQLALQSIDSALSYLEAGDPASSRLFLRAARRHLETLHERYAAPKGQEAQNALAALSADLAALTRLLDESGTEIPEELRSEIRVKEAKTATLLEAVSASSLYQPDVLRRIVARTGRK